VIRLHDFRRLTVWQKSRRLALEVYGLTARFPKEEQYGLTSQVKRAASSIPANIAEGCGRESAADMARFLHIAGGSACELESHLILAHDLGFLEAVAYESALGGIGEIKRMLRSLADRLRSQ